MTDPQTLTPEQLVSAGAIVAFTDGPAPTGTASYQARTYTHPALGGRPVVRLLPDELGVAEDQLLGFLGFGPSSDTDAVPVGLGRRRSLGFPAWAVVHDPEHIGVALAMVPALEEVKRSIRSSPGNAKDSLSWAGERLSLTAPRLAPSFYEEGGRAFIAEGNPTMAAALFTKARTAEAMYGLDVDEGTRAEAFLEFALAGALSAKALDEYARTLASVRPAAEAHQTFRRLAVQRTLGGLPPWTGMVATLKRLGRSAGVDADADAAAVLAEMSASPAFSRAPTAFWKASKTTVVAAARGREDVQLALLRITPEVAYSTDDVTTLWLEILTGSGAAEHLTSAASRLLPVGGPADWLSRICSVTYTRSPALERLVTAMRDRLVADGVAFTPVAGYRNRAAHLDLVDLALELGVPVAAPGERAVDLDAWLSAGTGHRELLALVADPDYGAVVDSAVEGHLRARPADDLLRVPGLRLAVGRWLARRAAATSRATVADLDATWKTTVARLTPEVVALDPVTAQQVVATDFSAALARTLNGGLLDELGWPALEQALDSAPGDTAVSFTSCWPHLLVRFDSRVVVVDADEVVLIHELQPTAAAVRDFRMLYVDGELLLAWRDSWNDPWQAYWSRDPRTTFELTGDPGGTTVPVPGGGVTLGGATLRRGDRSVDDGRAPVFGDGTGTWRLQHERGEWRCWEFDSSSNAPGRLSLPTLFQQGAAVGTLMPWLCRLYPTPAGPAGQWAAALPDGSVEVRTTTGLHFRGRAAVAPFEGRADARRREWASAPIALIPRPGTGDALLVFGGTSMRSVRLVGSGGTEVLADLEVGRRATCQAAGTAVVVPAETMPMLRPRSPSASARLRSVSVRQAGRLLDAAREELRAMPNRVDVERVKTMTRTRAAVLELLGKETHPRLVAGVIGMTLLAAVLESQRPISTPTPGATSRPPRERGLNDTQMVVVAGGLVPGAGGWWRAPATTMADDLDRAGQALARTEPAAPVEPEPAAEPDPPTRTAESGRSKPGRGLLSRIGRAIIGGPGPAAGSPPDTPPSGGVGGPFPGDPPAGGPPGSAEISRWTQVRPENLVGNGAALELIALLPVLAYRSALDVTPATERDLLRQFLAAWSINDLATQLPHLRLSTARYRDGVGTPLNVTMTCKTGRHVQARSRSSSLDVVVLEWFDSEPHALPDTTTTSSVSLAGRWGDVAQTSAFLERSNDVALNWSAEAVDHLAGRTGLPRGSAALILAGLPGISSTEHNFLPREQRESLGLKGAEAQTGRDQLTQLNTAQRCDLMLAVAGDPARLWEESATDRADRAASWWLSTFGRQIVVDEDLRLTAKAYTAGYRTGDAVEVAETVAHPESSTVLRAGSEPLDMTMLRNLVAVAVAAGQQAPVGDPLRLSAGRTLAALRARCEQPDASVVLGHTRAADPDLAVADLPQVPSPFPLAAGHTAHAAPPLLLVHDRTDARSSWADVTIHLRAAQLDEVSAEAELLADRSGVGSGVAVVDWITGPAAADLIDDLVRDDLPPGSSTLDPRIAAPATLQQVREHHRLSEEAATLYLQVLALPAPTAKRLTTANRWTSARLKKASSELVERQLVVAGKRARAQREIFLPGRWTDEKTPDLPLEEWKRALLRVTSHTAFGAACESSYASSLRYLLVPRSAGEHFRLSWQRVVDGDGPA